MEKTENLLEINNLVVRYGGIEAVRGISFGVPKGKIVTLIGSNGAGKSSTLRSVVGLVKPAAGSITFKGEDLLKLPTETIVTRGITMVPEGRRVFVNLTVAENLRMGAYMRKDSIDKDLERVYTLFPRLKERSWQPAGTLSGGEQQMLAIARALMSKPELVMMDEPSLGLAPIIVQEVFEIIREINREGTTILLIEQNANMALQTADCGYVMETGRITLSGTGRELAENEQVREAYLGKAKEYQRSRMRGEYPELRRNGHKRRKRLALCAGRFLIMRSLIIEGGWLILSARQARKRPPL